MPTDILNDDPSYWKRTTRFREWPKSLAVDPSYNLPYLLTSKEDRSAEIWAVSPPTLRNKYAADNYGPAFGGFRASLPAQNFP
jgi:hypothetical protein